MFSNNINPQNSFANLFGTNKDIIRNIHNANGKSAVNTNSIISTYKQYFLHKFTEQENPDIALLSETKLNNTRKFMVKNYNIIRNDRPNSIQGGGTAILIRITANPKQSTIAQSINSNVWKPLLSTLN